MTTMQGFPQNAGQLPIEVRQAAGRLWRLFPLAAHGWSAHAQILIESATCDIAQLERLNSENRGCNWGLATGPSSGVFAVDADDQNNAAGFVAYSMKYEGESPGRKPSNRRQGIVRPVRSSFGRKGSS